MENHDESTQIIVSRNGVTMLKPWWMSQQYWQTHEVPRCGKLYGKAKIPYGSQPSKADVLSYAAKQTEAVSGDEGACDGCTI